MMRATPSTSVRDEEMELESRGSNARSEDSHSLVTAGCSRSSESHPARECGPHPLSLDDAVTEFDMGALNEYVPVDTNQGSCQLQRVFPTEEQYEVIRVLYAGKERMYTILKSPPNNPNEGDRDRTDVVTTIWGIRQRYARTKEICVRPCPIGLSDAEKEKFCTMMEYLDDSIIEGEGTWRVFADNVMVLDEDDRNMIAKFTRETNIPIMEIILEHWNILRIENSHKCKITPSKEDLFQVLEDMSRRDILHALKTV